MLKINGITFRKMILNGAKLLDTNKEHVDALNVFPVPDGDTGTNMSLTMLSAAKEIAKCPSNSMEDLCAAFSKGALRGARGNSGVILSQIIKGISEALSKSEFITCKNFALALSAGSDVAYKAVTKPKEGTILTVIRSMSEAAVKMPKKDLEIDAFLQKIIDVGEETLKLTPELLPVLKKAGVVDAGGRGLLIIFQGFLNMLRGNEAPNLKFEDTIKEQSVYVENKEVDYNNLADIEFGYCTEFFIINLNKRTTMADIDRFRNKLMNIGDCVLVIGDLNMVKVHVHSNEPGTVLSYAMQLGEIDKIKIENMLQQNRDLLGKQSEQLKKYGLVAVCVGEGISNIFKDLLVDRIIEGGQTMNPSAEDIAAACDKVPAENVFIFPNNKNIILAAEQAKNLSKRTLHIIPTTNIPQGLSATLAFNPEDDLDNNIENMTEAMSTVKAGCVTYAVRSTEVDDLILKEGDIIGIDNNSIVAKGDKVESVTKDLVDKMMSKDVSNITLYFGNNLEECEAQNIADDLANKYKKCDIDVHFGGQPLYYFIVSLE